MLHILKSPAELDKEEYKLIEHTLNLEPAFAYYLKRVKSIFNSTAALNEKFEQREYQLNAAAYYCIQRRNLACLSQGLGKTLITALLIAAIYPEVNTPLLDIDTGLVKVAGKVQIAISSSTAAQRWLEDLQVIFNKDLIAYITKPSDLKKATLKPIWIYTHDFLKAKFTKKTRPQVSRYIGKYFRPSLLVVDEIHHLGNRRTQRYKELDWLSRKCKRFLGLSGTIVEGQLEALDAAMSLCYQGSWPYFRQPHKLSASLGSEVKLQTNYRTGSIDLQDGKVLQTIDWSKLVEYYQLMRAYAHRVSIDEPAIKASITLPNKVLEEFVVDMTDSQKVLYDDYLLMHKAELDFIAKQVNSSAAQQARAKNILYPLIKLCNVQGDPDTVSPKAGKLIDLCKQSTKSVIFCQHIESARYITNLLKKEFGKDQVVRLYATDDLEDPRVLSNEKRWKIISDFENSSKVRAGIFSLNLAAEAIDLVAADRVIFYCLPWSATKLDQALMRTIRPGNRNKEVKVTFITHSWGIDKYQLLLLKEKMKIANLMLDYDTGLDSADGPMASDNVLASISQFVLDAFSKGGVTL
jgi:superfamily II DNA or RNA helicase